MNSGIAQAFVCPDDEHHWVSSREPHAPIWVVRCSICGRHDFDTMLEGWVKLPTERLSHMETGDTANRWANGAPRLLTPEAYERMSRTNT